MQPARLLEQSPRNAIAIMYALHACGGVATHSGLIALLGGHTRSAVGRAVRAACEAGLCEQLRTPQACYVRLSDAARAFLAGLK